MWGEAPLTFSSLRNLGTSNHPIKEGQVDHNASGFRTSLTHDGSPLERPEGTL